MRRLWFGMSVMLMTTLLAGGATAAEDALPGMQDANAASEDYSEYEPRSSFSMSRWSIDRGYPGEVAEKFLFGLTDVVTTPIEFIATPFRRAFWADSSSRPVLEFFALGIPEGAMNASFRAWNGVANIATFPIASQRSRFNNYSIWYWDRYQAKL